MLDNQNYCIDLETRPRIVAIEVKKWCIRKGAMLLMNPVLAWTLKFPLIGISQYHAQFTQRVNLVLSDAQ